MAVRFMGKFQSAYKIYGGMILVSVIVTTGILWYQTRWNFFIIYFLIVNLITVLFYFWDKIISTTKIIRVPEIILHTLAMSGGSPSALLAQNIFRHKTRKTSFLVWYWLIVLVQIIVVTWIIFKK